MVLSFSRGLDPPSPFEGWHSWQESYTAAGEELHPTFSCLQPSLALFLPRGVGQTLLWQCPLAWAPAGTVTLNKQPGAAPAFPSKPSHRLPVSPRFLFNLSSEFLGFCLSLFPPISGTDMSRAVPHALPATGFSLKLQPISRLSTYLLTNIPHHSSKEQAFPFISHVLHLNIFP